MTKRRVKGMVVANGDIYTWKHTFFYAQGVLDLVRIFVSMGTLMTPAEYISRQQKDRIPILSNIHSIILQEDPGITPKVGPMMGKEMILYMERGYFKYGLAGVKNYMSMHIMPIYGGSPLHAKYQQLLPQMEFQKGCINFKPDREVPMEIIRRLFADCAKISIAAMLEKRNKRT